MKKHTFYDEIIQLETLADTFECEGFCDEKQPHIMCAECRASSALNYIGDIIETALKEDDDGDE